MWFNALIELKKKSGKTLKQISEESKVPLGTLNKLFSGQTKDPKLETVQSVVHALGYTLDDLENSHGEEKNPSGTAEAMPEEERISLEDSNKLLIALGLIQEGQDLSDDDLAFLAHIVGLLDAWFGKRK